MFDFGTKIVILTSTRKKGVGPRKGSIGYASACNNRGTFDKYGFLATINEVFFIRYGFETHSRIEKKAIISVFPIVKPDQGDIHTQVRSLIKRINSPKSVHIWDEIRSYFDVVPRVPVVIAAPLNCQRTDLTEVGTKEFYAWAESLMLNNDMLSGLNDALATGHYNNSMMKSIHHDSLEMLRHMMMDRGFKQLQLADMTANKNKQRRAVELIRATTAFLGRSLVKNNIMNYHSYLSGMLPDVSPGKLPPHVLMEHIGMWLYVPAIFNSLRDSLKSLGKKAAVQIMEDVELTKSEIMVLSSHLWRAGLVDGKTASKVK